MVSLGSELQGAFADSGSTDSRKRWILPLVLLLLAAGGLALYFLGEDQREVEQLLAQERYREALLLANDTLASRPDDESMGELHLQALARYLADGWLSAVARGDYEAVGALLEETSAMAPSGSAAAGLVEALA